MGKNTFLSIGKALPNRENVIVSTTMKSVDGCESSQIIGRRNKFIKRKTFQIKIFS